jgi:hypothetical protein
MRAEKAASEGGMTLVESRVDALQPRVSTFSGKDDWEGMDEAGTAEMGTLLRSGWPAETEVLFGVSE